MDAKLEIEQGGKISEVPCTILMTIGRDKKNDIVLHDNEVSRNHAVIRCLGDNDYYFMDLGSSNGSFINKKRISIPTLLQHKDKLGVGATKITFKQENKIKDKDVSQEPSTVIRIPSTKIEQITILVADIRGYTSLSEQIPINILSKFMSKWFQEVHACIVENNGTVDKFIGDCVYARWINAADTKESVINAMRSALEISDITNRLVTSNPDIKHPLKIGAGVNTGSAALGLTQDTALGDAVNLAFRLESATKDIDKDLILSADSYTHLPETCWQESIEEIKIKGRKVKVSVWGLMFSEIDDVLAKS